MINKKQLLILLSPLILFSGCSDSTKNEETFHTIEYYDKNINTREDRRKECASMTTATETIMRDCDNARQSYLKTQSPHPPVFNF